MVLIREATKTEHSQGEQHDPILVLSLILPGEGRENSQVVLVWGLFWSLFYREGEATVYGRVVRQYAKYPWAQEKLHYPTGITLWKWGDALSSCLDSTERRKARSFSASHSLKWDGVGILNKATLIFQSSFKVKGIYCLWKALGLLPH